MFDAIASVLEFCYGLVPDYAVAIALLTLLVMLLLTPLTLKGTRSMIAMQRLQPEMKKIQQQHKDDRQKLNEELLAFYKENQINPLGGCLPLLLQMPVFLVLFRIVQGLTRRDSDGLFDPRYLDQSSELYEALHGSREMLSFGVDLAESATSAVGDGIIGAIPPLMLVLAVAATSFVQQRQVSGRNPNAVQNPQQQMLMRLMPGFFAFISLTLPAGVVVYFLVSNLYRIGQQAWITRTMYAGDDSGQGDAKKASGDAGARKDAGAANGDSEPEATASPGPRSPGNGPGAARSEDSHPKSRKNRKKKKKR